MRPAIVFPTPGSSIKRSASAPAPSGAAFSSVSAARSYAMNLKNGSPANSMRVRISRKRSAISRLVGVGRERGRVAPPACAHPSLPPEGRRLDPAILNLPVEKMRDGYYSDTYFNRAREILEADRYHPRVRMQVFQRNH